AARDYGEEVCIYDCGTALTIDVLIQGRHQGGLIFPGSRLLQRSLWQGAQAIPTDLAPAMPIEPALANNTAQCVANGSVFALLAIIRQFADQAGQRPAGQQAVHLLCGGEAERLLPWLDQRFLHRPHLVLQGLATIAMAQ
ncbi:MAG: type III pantothenate kinase, partial [Gammaproteobacteria bacterium]|nr:type III pantothenate kinase [Gammaproteobacteria bacterium]